MAGWFRFVTDFLIKTPSLDKRTGGFYWLQGQLQWANLQCALLLELWQRIFLFGH